MKPALKKTVVTAGNSSDRSALAPCSASGSGFASSPIGLGDSFHAFAKTKDVDQRHRPIEVNEAFASVVLAVARDLPSRESGA